MTTTHRYPFPRMIGPHAREFHVGDRVRYAEGWFPNTQGTVIERTSTVPGRIDGLRVRWDDGTITYNSDSQLGTALINLTRKWRRM